ncbi:MAG: hypothetical protein V2A34_11680 [Lentisphaerota bacterium]
MKILCKSFGVIALSVACFSSAYAVDGPIVIVPKTAPTKVKPQGLIRTPVGMPFFVYNNAIVPPVDNFSMSGYMGDVSDIKVMGGFTNRFQEAAPCLKIVYLASGEQGWAGLIWQNPANNWGDMDGGYNLTKAKALSFWARGNVGGEVVEFKLGGMAAKHPESDSILSGSVTLKNEWTQYKIDLNEANLDYISSGFTFIIKQEFNPSGCTFYMDDIRYDAQ